MTLQAAAAVVHALATAVVVAFELALAAGAPWGSYAMGGGSPGRLPRALRVAALVQAAVLALLALVVIDGAGVLALGWTAAAPWLAWVPVAVSLASVTMNALTRSAVERRTWLPVGVVLLACSTVVAIG